MQYLVVAGGGGGGGGQASEHGGGGGGGGGFRTGTLSSLGSSLSVTIGAGGSGGQGGSSPSAGTSGGNSALGSIVAIGGGGGGSYYGAGPSTGGSGGGAGASNDASKRVGASGTSGQGTAGGNVTLSDIKSYHGAGGGGAGSSGGSTSNNGTYTTSAGTGGTGSSSSISGSTKYYAGGGGGGGSNKTRTEVSGGANGGTGGGGKGATYSTTGLTQAVAGTANTGGGGGGGSGSGGSTGSNGASGGSGIVIVRYAIPKTLTLNNNGSTTTQQLQPGSTPTNPGSTRTGFALLGWSDAADNSAEYAANLSDYTMPSADDTLYAVWKSSLVLALDATDTNSYSSGTSITNLGSHDGNATLTTRSPSTSSTSVSGQAFEFPADNDGAFIDIAGTMSASQFSSGITIDTYAALPQDLDNSHVWDRIIDFGVANDGEWADRSSNLLLSRSGNTNDLILQIYDGAFAVDDCIAPNALDGTLKRYTITLDGSSCQMWVDGTRVTNDTTMAALPPAAAEWDNLYIGRSNWIADTWQEGEIRSIRIFSSALTPAEIDSYNSGDLTYKTVNLNADGGSLNATPISLVTSGTLALPISGPTRAGYTFAGWAESSGGSNLSGLVTPSSNPDTVYALWSATSNTVAWDSNGGSAVSDSSFTTGGTIAKPTSPTKSGKIFVGWSTSETSDQGDIGNRIETWPYSSPATSNTTLYAIWYEPCTTQTDSFTISGSNYNSISVLSGADCAIAVPAGVASIDTLVVGGGGGGGLNVGAGGAGGGVYFKTGISVAAADGLVVNVGAGGAGGSLGGQETSAVVPGINGANGGNSSLKFADLNLFANGGSGGKTYWPSNQCVGTGSPNAPQSAGGSALAGGVAGTGGVGGAGAQGSGNGSNGAAGYSINFFATSSTYGSGGGGGSWGGSASGGIGGTGAGSGGSASGSAGSSGGANLGAGGGGGSITCGAGGSGGSGLVAVRYLTPLSISTPSSGLSATVASPYSLSISATGAGGFTYSVSSGTLPDGLSIDTSTGVISGTPTTAGDSNIAVTVVDSSTSSATTSSFTISVTAATLSNVGTPTVSATSGTLKSIDVSWTSVANASSYSLKIYDAAGTTLLDTISLASNLTSYTITDASGSFEAIATATQYQISLTAVGTGNYVTSDESAKASVTTLAAYAVTFNANGATGGTVPDPQVKIHGATLGLATNSGSLVRAGYTFAGWNTQSDGQGTDYAAGANYTGNAILPLFAKWTANTNTVVWDSNGGSSVANSSFTTGGTLSKPTDPTKTDKIFGGWSTSETSNQGDIANRITSWPYSPSETSGFTLYAIWLSVAPPQSVSATSANQALLVQWTAPSTAATDVPTAYQVEWSTTGKATGTWNVSSSSIAASATSHTVTGLTNDTNYYVRVTALYNGAKGAYGYPWTKLYEVIEESRTQPGAIVYANGFGLTDGAASTYSSAQFSRVRYRMQANYGGQLNYADVDFDRVMNPKNNSYSEDLDSVARLQVPTHVSSQGGVFEIQGDVSDMTVQSNVEIVDLGVGVTGRLEIWPWNYGTALSPGLSGGSGSTYDFNDTAGLSSDHGSFQVHNLNAAGQTVMAWNKHRTAFDGEIGFGNNNSGAGSSDWTNSTQAETDFNLQIFANIPVAPVADTYTINFNYNGGDGGNRPVDADYTVGGTAITLPAPTISDGRLFGGWYSDSGLTTFVGYAGTTYAPSANGNLYARWTNLLINLDGSNGDSLANSGTTWNSVLPGASNAQGAALGNASYFGSDGSIEGFTLNGNGDYIQFAKGVGKVDGSMTVEAWINPSSLRNGWNIIASRWFVETTGVTRGGQDWHFAIYKDGSGALLNLYTSTDGFNYPGNHISASYSFDLSTAKWHLVGFSLDASGNLQFYVNGSPDGEVKTGVPRTGNDASYLWIGDPRQNVGFNGKVSEFRIFNKALTAAEIQSGFAAKASTYGLANIELKAGANGTGNTVTGFKYDDAGFSLPDAATANSYFARANHEVVGWSINADGSTTDYALGSSYTNNANVTLYPVWRTTAVEALGDTWVQSGSSAGSNFGASEYLLFKNASNSITNSYNRVSFAEFAFDPDAVWSGAALEVHVTGNADGSRNNGYNISYTTFNIDVYGANDASWDEAALTFTGARNSTQGWGINTTTWPWNPKSATYLGTISIPTSSSTVGKKYSLATAALDDFLNADADGAVTIYMRRSDTDSQANLSLASSENASYAGPTLALAGTGYEYTVAYDINGGTGSVPASGTYTQGQSGSYTIAPTTGITAPVNKTLVGWNTKADGTGQDYAAGDSYSTTRSVTLYAKYVDNPVVTFNSNFTGGPTAITQRVAYDSATALRKNTFIRPGYSFAGWNDNADGTSGNGYADEAQITTTSAVTLYAKWTAQSVTVSYDRGLATEGSPSKTTEGYTIDTAGGLTLATQNTMKLAGHTFGGWTTVNGDATTAKTDGYNPTTSVKLYALWTPVNYTVSYLTTGSDSGTAPTDATNYNIGQKMTVKGNTGPMVKSGYTFAGWTVQGGDGTVFGSGDQIEFGAANIVLVPSWTANTYTVTFNKNGASGTTPTSQTFTVDQDTNVPLPSIGDMDKVGYTFTGWATSANGTGQTGTYVPTQSVTLYAIWQLKTINIDYVAGTAGGQDVSGLLSLMPADITGTKKYGQSLTIASVDSTVTVGGTQFKFFGWKDSSNVVYQIGQTITLGASDYTLTAQWVELYAVRYALNGGTGQPLYDADDCQEIGYKCVLNQGINLHGAPIREGYTFDGWLDSSGQLHAAGGGLTVSGTNYLLYAQWTAIDYQMTFDENGGSGSASTLTGKHVGDVVTLPAAPGTKTGYNFTGWSDGSATYGSQTLYTMGAANVDFTAVWTPKVLVITYDWNGGSSASVTPYSYTFGTGPLPLPSGTNASRDGYDFVGWSETIAGTAVAAGYAPSASRTLYAVWTPGNYSIQLNGRGSQTSLAARSVALGGTLSLPAPSRDGFAFEGWYSDANFTKFVGKAGDNLNPDRSLTLHAKWTQLSLAGVNTGALINLDSLTMAGGAERGTFGNHTKSGTGYSLSIPAGSLPDGTNVNVSIVDDPERASELLNEGYAYFSSVIVHWLQGTGDAATVPVAASGKPLVLVLKNDDIRAGSKVFMNVGGTVTEVATATIDGEVSIEFYEDPEFIVAATVPDAPTAVTASGLGELATVSWTAPASDGGSDIVSYTVTSSGGQSCTTTRTTCTVAGLTVGTSYTFSVVATNGIGDSAAGTTAQALTTTPSSYEVTFDSNGGSAVASSTFPVGGTVLSPGSPSRSGFNFGGWSTVLDDADTKVNFPYAPGVDSNITLYALWSAVTASGGGTSTTPSGPAAGIGAVSDQTWVWTKRINKNEVKVYIKFPEMGANYQINLQKNDGEYSRKMSKTINTTADTDLRVVGEWYYLVRTITLPGEGRYRIEVTQDGQRVTLNGQDRPAVYSYR